MLIEINEVVYASGFHESSEPHEHKEFYFLFKEKEERTMPCYEVRTVSVEFKVGNIELLKKALAASGCEVYLIVNDRISFKRSGRHAFINLADSTIKSEDFDEKELPILSNTIKRAYSSQVIDEIARKQKWMKKKMGENRFQLQRF